MHVLTDGKDITYNLDQMNYNSAGYEFFDNNLIG